MSWIGVDLDGTLAEYHGVDADVIGKPIMPMVTRVLDWCNAGQEVRIFTARASDPRQIPPVVAWCKEHLGRELLVTCSKDFEMSELYDDRAVQVEINTGKLIGYSTRDKR